MGCQHNTAVTNADGKGCYVCAQNRSMISSAFAEVAKHVGRRIKVSGPGGERYETIVSVSCGRGIETAHVAYRTDRGEVRTASGFDVAFRWHGWVITRAPRSRKAA